MKATFAALCAVACFATAFSQIKPRTVGQLADYGGIYARNYASERGFIAPDSLAKIEGAEFVSTGFPPVMGGELPKEVGGVRVWLGNVECGLRSVSPRMIVFLVPEVGYGWQLLTTQTLNGWHSTLALVLPLSPGIFTNPDGTPHGEAFINSSQIVPFVQGATTNSNTQLRFWGTGFRRAADVTAFIGNETMLEMVSVKVSSHPLFAGIDFALMDLPPGMTGEVSIVLFANGLFYSNEVRIKVE